MKLKSLYLTDYRNCEDLELNFDKSKTLIIGKNAQGKTNILESIFFLSGLKTPRTSNLTELIKFNKDYLKIEAEVLKSDTDINLYYVYNTEKKREIKVNKVKSNTKDFKSVLKTVLFSTNDLLLLRGTPQDRRDWLDRAISQIYPAYDDRLSKYEKIRIQKNNYLKEYAKTGKFDKALFDVFNEQLSVTGSNIIYIRLKFLKEIEKIAQEKHRTISETENLIIKYDCSFLKDGNSIEQTQNSNTFSPRTSVGEGLGERGFSIEQIQYSFLEALDERKEEEIRRGQACVGPHRDDVAFYINNQEATKYASQGQQRTIVLALKLSELDIITQKTGDEPILLLDDVLAELDDIRQNYLLKSINQNTQTIITSVDTILFEEQFLKDVEIFKIENGALMNP
ncbi:DNA replication/repair protein RecF [bacterium]|nr:DNA replication/repair protein RecF [bacterium]